MAGLPDNSPPGARGSEIRAVRTWLSTTLGAAALLALSGGLSGGRLAAQDYKVIVNAGNAVASLNAAQVSDYFLKRTTTWSGGQRVAPVEPQPQSATRAAFSKAVHKKDVASVKAYWQELVFSGRDTPPAVKASDDEIVAYVKANPGAIGYVSAAAETAGVKVVTVK